MTRQLEVSTSTGYRWVILGAAFLVQATTALGYFAFGPLAPFLRDAFNINRTQIGLFSSLLSLASVLFLVPGGWLVDKFGIRRLLFLGPCVFGLFFALMSQASTVQIAYLMVFVAGIGYLFVGPTTTKALVVWFPLRMRATSISIKQSALTAGSAIGAVLAPSLALGIGWRNTVAAIGAVAVVFAALSYGLYRQSPVEVSSAQPPGLKEIRQALANRQLLLFGLLGAFYVGVQFTFAAYLVLYLVEVRQWSEVIAGTYLMVANIAGAFARVAWGAISDRVFGGRRRPVMVITGIISAASILVVSFSSATAPPWSLYLLVALFGATGIAYNGVYMTFGAELAGKQLMATGLAWAMALSLIGGFIGPPLFGYIVDSTSSYSLAWLIFGIAAAAAAILLALIKEHKSQL